MEEPMTTFIRRKAIFEWLGITRDDLEKCVSAGLIHPVTLPGATYKKYLTKEVKRVFTPGYAEGLRPGKPRRRSKLCRARRRKQ